MQVHGSPAVDPKLGAVNMQGLMPALPIMRNPSQVSCIMIHPQKSVVATFKTPALASQR